MVFFIYAAYVVELLETAKQTCTDPVVMIEQRVNFSRWVQDGFGTANCIVIADGVMNICDYKHGKGVEVSAVVSGAVFVRQRPNAESAPPPIWNWLGTISRPLRSSMMRKLQTFSARSMR